MYNICIMGASFNSGNMGVSALASSLVQLMYKGKEHASITLFIGGTDNSPQYLDLEGSRLACNVVNFRLSPKARIHEHLLWILALAVLQRVMPSKNIREKIIRSNHYLHSLNQADFTGDIRGGDSFSDIYGLGRFLIGSIPSIIAVLLGKKLVLLPQTYGPYSSNAARAVARYIVRRAVCILSRDRAGIGIVNELLGAGSISKDVAFCPDVAFVMAARKPDRFNVVPAVPADHGGPLVGLNINGLLYNGGYTRNNMFGLKFDYKTFVHALAKRLMENTDARLLLIPHTFAGKGHVESDPDACQEVYDTLRASHRERIHLATGDYDQSEIKGIIGICDFFIGSRMHSCIGALSQGIPTVGVAYSRKFVGVFDSIGAGDMAIDARTTGMDEALGKICMLFSERNRIKGELEGKIKESNAAIIEKFDYVINKYTN